jgi:hypothetical protein
MVQSALVGILFVRVFSKADGTADGTQTMRVIKMKVNLWKWCVLVVVVLVGRQTAVLAEDGGPSATTLREMGLSGLAIMSDDEAMDVRGEGFGSGGSSASAWGSSFANIETPFGSAASENGYSAHGKHEADGSNLSFAGVEITTSGGDHGHQGKPPKDSGMGGDKGSKGHGSKGGDMSPGKGKGGDKGGNGGYGGGGDKGSKGHGNKGSGGDKGGYGGGGDKGSKGHSSKGGGGYGGGSKGGGAPKTVSKVVFAGGSSRAHAH